MTLEQQVTSLEPSKKLKKLGVKQESLYFWCDFEGKIILRHKDDRRNLLCTDDWRAYTLAELSELVIPHWHELEKLPSEFTSLEDDAFIKQLFSADFWAAALIYLLENDLITL